MGTTAIVDWVPIGVTLVALGLALFVGAGAIVRRGPVQRAAAVASIAVLATLLRLFRLGTPSLWLDELGTWWILDSATVGELSDRLFAVVPNGGVYYWLLYAVTRVCGRSEWVLRAPSAICGLLSIAGLALVARRLAPDRPRLPYLVALLLSATYLHTVLSQDARPYTLVYLFGVLATYFWVRLLQADGAPIGNAVGLAIASVALVREQWLAALFVAALWAPLVGIAVARRRAGPLALALGLTIALFVPALAKFKHDFGRMPQLDWMAGMSTRQQWITAAESLADPIPLVTLLVALLLMRRRLAPAAPLLWVIATMLGLALFALVALGKLFFVQRYLFPLSIPALLAAGLLLDRAFDERPRLVRALVLVVLAGSLAGLQARSLIFYGTFKDYRRGHQWRDAIAALDADRRPTDLLLLRSGFIEEDHATLDGEGAQRSREFAQGILAGAYNRQSYERLSLTKSWDPARFGAHQARLARAVDEALAGGRRVVIFGVDGDAGGRSYFACVLEWLAAANPDARLARASRLGQIERWTLERAGPRAEGQ